MQSKIAEKTWDKSSLLSDKDFVTDVKKKVRRSDVLPMLFNIHGSPFSLEHFPQFRALYDEKYAPNTIFMCGRQVGKSANLARYETLNCIQIPHFQILYVAPLQSQAHRYSTLYLREAITSCSLARELQNPRNAQPDSGAIIKAVGHQAFLNSAGIQMTYAKTSADRARGIYADQIDCDELQDHLVDNVAVIMQSLTQSKWGLRRYTGTAKTMDNTIEHYWQKSSMSEWVTKCTGCNHWNIPNKDGRIYDMVQPQGPSCVKCGKLLPVHRGIWVPAHPDRVAWFTGYHIPQVVVPEIAYNPAKWYEMYDKVHTLPEATVYQEVFGISSSVGARLITQEDIDKRSVLPSPDALQKKLKDYVCTVGGIDWGVAEETSFTVHTVIGVRRDGKIHVLWAKRYVGFDTDTLLKDIAQTHRFYKCQLLCADHGVGFAQNTLLSHRFGLPVVQMQYSSQKQLLSYKKVVGHPRWIVDKVTALELLFFAIRYGHIFFPPQSDFKKFTDDLLSPFQVMTTGAGLEAVRFVRNPAAADDFCHALCFAVLGAIRLNGGSMLDLVPKGAMGADMASVSVPTADTIDTSAM